MTVYNFKVQTIKDEEKSLADYEGKVLLIVNTASKCGLTPQYKELQELYDTYNEQGLEILGFPCNQFAGQEPGTETEIQEFCQLKYNVTFPMFAKVNVNGADTHPLYKYLKEQATGVLGSKTVKWNFTKFLVDRNGQVIERFAPKTNPNEIRADIEKYLK